MNKVQAELADYLSGTFDHVSVGDNLHDWQSAMSFMASICESLTDDAKTRLILLMERVAKETQAVLDNIQAA